jgi:hypothetical protein
VINTFETELDMAKFCEALWPGETITNIRKAVERHHAQMVNSEKRISTHERINSMSKKFPCPYCKGKGSWIERVTDEGQGPRYDCGICDGEGMIEINGPLHNRLIELKSLKPTNQVDGD